MNFIYNKISTNIIKTKIVQAKILHNKYMNIINIFSVKILYIKNI